MAFIMKQSSNIDSLKILHFRCTHKRDREFEDVFADRIDLNGSRIKTAMYLRRYVA